MATQRGGNRPEASTMDNGKDLYVPPSGASEPGSVTLERAPQSLPLAMATGTILHDRYCLTGLLEVGHVATIYRAEEVETGRAVAVKIFHEVGRNDRSRLEVLHRPGPGGAPRLELPSAFVAVHDCGFTADGRLFLVTEVVEGPSVADLLMRTPSLAPIRALELAMRIGEALEAVLNLGLLDLRVLPRDVVVVNDGDRVKLRGSDLPILRRLGLADGLEAAEAPGRDPRYASPEELAGLPATERSVVYRFGVLVYELLCGSPPFAGTTPAQVRDRQLRRLAVRLQDPDQELPPAVERLVSRMLDPDPRARPEDLTWIVNELWEAACYVRAKNPGVPGDPALLAGPAVTPGRRFWTRRLALVGGPVLALSATLLAWPYLVKGPTARTSVVAPARPAVDVGSSPTPVVPAGTLLPPPSDPATPSGGISRQAPSLEPPAGVPAPTLGPLATGSSVGPGATSPPRVPSEVPTVSRGAHPEIPPARARARPSSSAVAPIPKPALPPLAETPASRSAATPTESEPTPVRVGPSPPPVQQTVTSPSARPAQPPVESARATDPGAIIEWLVREGPRISE
jgi:hypothetical protein